MGLFDSIKGGMQKAVQISQGTISDVTRKASEGISSEKIKQGKTVLSDKITMISEKTSQLSQKLPGKDDVADAFGKLRKAAEQAVGRK